MKIATWNIERLAHKSKLGIITNVCNEVAADILVLTEADERVQLLGYTPYSTAKPLDHELPLSSVLVNYASTERRVIIYSKYPCVQQHGTYDETTAVCVELATEYGNLLVYGSIIGIYGHRKPFFMDALHSQITDLKRLAADGHHICFLGDYNCSFADNYFPSNNAKSALLECFTETSMTLLTADCLECIDHVSISKDFMNGAAVSIAEWNLDKSLSDHKGITVTI